MDRRYLSAYFRCMHVATYKEMRDDLQSGQQDASQAEKENERRKRDRNPEDECSTKKRKRPPPTYQNPWPLATNNFFAPLPGFTNENCGAGKWRKPHQNP
jgi:hypothetical protein